MVLKFVSSFLIKWISCFVDRIMTPISPTAKSDLNESSGPSDTTNQETIDQQGLTWDTFPNYPSTSTMSQGDFASSSEYYYQMSHGPSQSNSFDQYRTPLNNSFYGSTQQYHPLQQQQHQLPQQFETSNTYQSNEAPLSGPTSLAPISSQIVESNYLLTGIEPILDSNSSRTYSSTTTCSTGVQSTLDVQQQQQPQPTYIELDTPDKFRYVLITKTPFTSKQNLKHFEILNLLVNTNHTEPYSSPFHLKPDHCMEKVKKKSTFFLKISKRNIIDLTSNS